MSGGDVVTVTFELTGLDCDAAEAACLAAGALAVTYTDTRDDAILEPAPGEFRLWPAPRLQATFPGDADPALLRAVLCAALSLMPGRLHVALLEDRAWEREWLRDFKPMRFGRRLWVSPAGAHVANTDAVVLRLDPGLAFGTGTHPTTRMCLEWLDAHPPTGLRLIDYGCGSGILALAALQLGAQHAWCHDIDPQALIATRDNALGNTLGADITLVSVADELPPQVDLLLANILSGPLCALASALSQRVRPAGHIVLSGLLHEQAAELRRAYAPWFGLEQFAHADGWICLAGQRCPPAQSHPGA